MNADHDVIAGVSLLILAALWLVGAVAWMLVIRRRRRAHDLQAARRRHPSARPTMSERERKFHGSDQWGM